MKLAVGGPGPNVANVVRAEWRKLWAVRATTWTLCALPLLGVIFAVFFSSGGGRDYTTLSATDRLAFDPTATSLRTYLTAQLFVGVLGVLVITTEYGTGLINTTITAVPRRNRLLAAKVAVLAMAAFIFGELTAFASYFIGQSVIAGYGAPSTTLTDPGVFRAVSGMGLYLVLTAVLGFAVGTLVRSTAGGLAIMVSVTLIFPGLSQSLPDALKRGVAQYWPNLAGSQIMTVYRDPGLLSPTAGFWLYFVSVAVVIAAAIVSFRKRDI